MNDIVDARSSQVSKAAEFALMALASQDGMLRIALNELNAQQDVVQGLDDLSVEAVAARFSKLHDFLESLTETTGVPVSLVAQPLVSQLRQVSAFVGHDGDVTNAKNVDAVVRLIKSGRLDLFPYEPRAAAR